jgi:hypothetical protein
LGCYELHPYRYPVQLVAANQAKVHTTAIVPQP